MAALKYWNGSAWVIARPKTRSGGAWQDKAKFWDGSSWVPLYLQVVLAGFSHSTSRTGANCTCSIRIDFDGGIYLSNNEGNFGTSTYTYIQSGTGDEVWVERTINSGSLSIDDIGAGRVQLISDKVIGVVDTSDAGGAVTGDIDLRFYDAASGGNLLETTNVTLSALRESGA